MSLDITNGAPGAATSDKDDAMGEKPLVDAATNTASFWPCCADDTETRGWLRGAAMEAALGAGGAATASNGERCAVSEWNDALRRSSEKGGVGGGEISIN